MAPPYYSQRAVFASLRALFSFFSEHFFMAVQSFVSTRLDYCNSLMYGIADGLMQRLQAVQNAAACLITGARRRDRISTVLSRSTQPFTPPGSVNEYQLRLGRQRQVWLILIADERVGVQIKLSNPLRTRAIPERFCGGDSLRRGATGISSVCTFFSGSCTGFQSAIGSSVQAGRASVQSAAWASPTVLDGRLSTRSRCWSPSITVI